MRIEASLLIILLAACAAPAPVSPPPPASTSTASTAPDLRTAEVRHTFLTSGRPTGAQVETRLPDGSRVSKFHFNDRGRGPEVTIHVWTGDDDLAERVEVRGVDYFKVAVKEDFVQQGNEARWDNASEHEVRTTAEPVFYLTLNGGPEEWGRLARALLASKNGKLALLPAGEATISTLGTHEVMRGAEKKTVTLYAISGISFDPNLLWLEADGSLFAGVGDWTSIILEGWEESAAALLTRQHELEVVRLKEMAARLARRPAQPVAFRGVGLFDPMQRKVLPGQTVVVRGEKIAAVGPAGKVKIPAGAEIIDGKGRTLLPGLWDMHVHIGDTDGILQLAAGVTSVRDMGNNIELLMKRKQAFDAGEILGPRIAYSGFIDGPGPYAGPIGKLVANEAELKTAIEGYAAQGVEQIKLYSSLDPKLVPIAVKEAKARGLRVSGHVPNGMHASDFVRAGADELQHINFLVLNFLEVPDTRTPERFHAVGREAAAIDLSSPKVQEFIELLVQRHTVVDTTVNTFESMFISRPGEVDPGVAPVVDRLPAEVSRQFRRGGLAPAGKEELYRAAYDMMVRYVGELHKKGVTLVIGTDSIAGFSLHRELELYVRAGVPSGEALRIATLGAARVMKRDDRLGRIAPGMLADLVLVEGDPTRKIEDIRNTVLTMKGGTLYDSEALYQAEGMKPR